MKVLQHNWADCIGDNKTNIIYMPMSIWQDGHETEWIPGIWDCVVIMQVYSGPEWRRNLSMVHAP